MKRLHRNNFATLSTLAARHSRMAAILHYRGLHAEALMATRLDNIDTLISAIRTVLDDLRVARHERPELADRILCDDDFHDMPRVMCDRDGGDGAAGDALEQRRLVEAVLEAALALVRTSAAPADPDQGQPWAVDAGLGEGESGYGTAS